MIIRMLSLINEYGHPYMDCDERKPLFSYACKTRGIIRLGRS